MTKRLIDRRRDAAVSMEISDESDRSPLREMIPLDGAMCIVKEKSIWQMRLADNIDPQRTNASIPNSRQKLMARGSSDPLVARTLLQAKRLLKSSMLPEGIPVAEGLFITFRFLTELDALQSKADEFNAVITATNEAFLNGEPSSSSLQVPGIGDVASRGKDFIQGADHSVRSLCELIHLFYPDVRLGKGWFGRFTTRMRAAGDHAQYFALALEQLEPGIGFLRNARNAVEHPEPGQAVIFNDYRLKADGKVHVPSIEVIAKDTALPETDLTVYFRTTVAFLVSAYEALLVHLCVLHVQPFAGCGTEVVELAPDQRRYTDVKYAYASKLGGQLVPYVD